MVTYFALVGFFLFVYYLLSGGWLDAIPWHDFLSSLLYRVMFFFSGNGCVKAVQWRVILYDLFGHEVNS